MDAPLIGVFLTLAMVGCSQSPRIESISEGSRPGIIVRFPEDAQAIEISFWKKPEFTLLWGLNMDSSGSGASVKILEFGVVPENMRQEFPKQNARPGAPSEGEVVRLDASYTRRGSFLTPVKTARKSYQFKDGRLLEVTD